MRKYDHLANAYVQKHIMILSVLKRDMEVLEFKLFIFLYLFFLKAEDSQRLGPIFYLHLHFSVISFKVQVMIKKEGITMR